MSGGVDWLYEFGSLLPSIGVGLLFWFAIRALLRADRREREADRQAERDWAATHPALVGATSSVVPRAADLPVPEGSAAAHRPSVTGGEPVANAGPTHSGNTSSDS
ncbi:hypothetical protein ACT3TZ_11125 [Brachybacterium sp. AOP25-B2-12]|uniref:hypothetical protein n=1 Tax=Brachybacterium sp. AOP25-B2-12 TaxID=3457710 RepID=UPI0040342F8C